VRSEAFLVRLFALRALIVLIGTLLMLACLSSGAWAGNAWLADTLTRY